MDLLVDSNHPIATFLKVFVDGQPALHITSVNLTKGTYTSKGIVYKGKISFKWGDTVHKWIRDFYIKKYPEVMVYFK